MLHKSPETRDKKHEEIKEKKSLDAKSYPT